VARIQGDFEINGSYPHKTNTGIYDAVLGELLETWSLKRFSVCLFPSSFAENSTASQPKGCPRLRKKGTFSVPTIHSMAILEFS